MIGRIALFAAPFAILIGLAGWAIGFGAVIGDLYAMLYVLFTVAISLVAVFSVIGARRRDRPAVVPPMQKAHGQSEADNLRDPQTVMKLLSTAIDLCGQIIAQTRQISHDQIENGPNTARDLRIASEGLMLIWGQLQFAEPVISFQVRRLSQSVQLLIQECIAPVEAPGDGVLRFTNPQHRRKIAENIVDDGNDLLSVLANAQDRYMDAHSHQDE